MCGHLRRARAQTAGRSGRCSNTEKQAHLRQRAQHHGQLLRRQRVPRRQARAQQRPHVLVRHRQPPGALAQRLPLQLQRLLAARAAAAAARRARPGAGAAQRAGSAAAAHLAAPQHAARLVDHVAGAVGQEGAGLAWTAHAGAAAALQQRGGGQACRQRVQHVL